MSAKEDTGANGNKKAKIEPQYIKTMNNNENIDKVSAYLCEVK
jgi:hypothetical protein